MSPNMKYFNGLYSHFFFRGPRSWPPPFSEKPSFEIMANLCDTLFQKPLKCCVAKKSRVGKIDFSTLFRSRENLKIFLSCSPELSRQYWVTNSKMSFFSDSATPLAYSEIWFFGNSEIHGKSTKMGIKNRQNHRNMALTSRNKKFRPKKNFSR